MKKDKNIKAIKTPNEIWRQFRIDLGNINPHVILMDIAIAFFDNHIKSSGNSTLTLRNVVSKYNKQFKLYTDHLDIKETKNFTYISQLAFIQSQADRFCNYEILNHEYINSDFKIEAKGDFLRKTLYVILRSTYSITPSNPVSNDDISKILNVNELLMIDYYRNIRNEGFHGTISKNNFDKLLKLYQMVDKEEIFSLFKIRPNEPNNINRNDVILFSKIWQTIVLKICSRFINIEANVMPTLSKKYRNKKVERATNGIKQVLKREYLQSDDSINDLINNYLAG